MATMRNHPAYKHWRGVKQRCESPALLKNRPTYLGTTLCEEWQDFWKFAEWCEQQVGFGKQGRQLDKDLLVPGCKIYSPNTCVFVPNEINCLFSKGRSGSKGGFVGIVLSCGKFRVRVTCLGIKYFDKVFESRELAIEAYKREKLRVVHMQATKWKDEISPELYRTLISMSKEDI